MAQRNNVVFRGVFLKTLYEMRSGIAWWSGILFLMFLWLVSLYPAISDIPEFASFIEQMPDSYKVLVGDNLSLSDMNGFLSLYITGMALPVMGVIIAISFNGGFISNEEESGTLDLLLSYPVPRWRVLLEKVLALLVFVLLVLAASGAAVGLGAVMIDESLGEVHLLEGLLNLLPLVFFFGGLTLCLTGLKRGRGLAVGVSSAFAGITYFINNLGSSVDMPEWLDYISPWYYYGGDSVLANGINWQNFLLLAGLSVLLYAVGVWGFSQRELAA